MPRLYPYETLFGKPLLKISGVTLFNDDGSNDMPLPDDDIDEEYREEIIAAILDFAQKINQDGKWGNNLK